MKRVLSLVMCVLMLLSCVPLTGIYSDGGSLTASAAGVDVSELQSLYNSIPKKSEWASSFEYTQAFEDYYNAATAILKFPENYDQATVDRITSGLKKGAEDLVYYASKVTLNKTSASLYIGDKLTLKATVSPSNASKEVTWKSSDSAVTVSNGVVTVVKYTSKTVTITATSKDGKAKATCAVTVLNPLGSIKLSATSKTIYDNEKFTLGVTLIGSDTSVNVSQPDKAVFYFDSTDRSVATVDESGRVTPLKAGKTDITVKVVLGSEARTAKCSLTVNELIRITSLNPVTKPTDGKINVVAGETTTFKLTILPSTATKKTIKWSSSNTKVAKITSISVSGNTAIMKFEALTPGTSKITYAATDGTGKSGSFTAVVLPYVSSLSISEKVKVIAPGSASEKLKVTVAPKNAGNQTLDWKSSNEKICTVDRTGRLKAVANGVCTITATTRDGSNISVSCKVRVAAGSSSVSVSPSTLKMDGSKTVQLTATVRTIENTTYKDCVRWVSDNPSVASVSSSGVVTARKSGTAKITAVTADGKERTAACLVTVNMKVQSVTIPSSLTLGVKKTYTLKPTVKPSTASNKAVTWSSSNTSVATVDSKGVVTAKKVGTATITVKTKDGGHTAKCKVSVIIPTTGIKLSKTSVSLKTGSTVKLTAAVSPSNATNKTITWSTSNKNVAVVSSSGEVRGVAGGKCTITGKSSGGQTATCTVSVSQDVSTVKLNTTSFTIYMTETNTLKATVSPSTATYGSIKWTSSNSKIASVSSKGVVTGNDMGTATITAEAGGKKATCTVKVLKNTSVTSVKLNYTKATVGKGNNLELVATISPYTASNKKVTWKSENTSVATVNSSGVVKGVKIGNTKVTATTVDGKKTATCLVTVAEGVTGIKLNTESVKLSVKKTYQLSASVFPTYADNKKVIWTSSKSSVATVSSKGLVTAVANGTTVITAKTMDGGYVAQCTVKVYNMVTSVSLTKKTLTMAKGESKALGCTVKPSNATNPAVTWSSSNKLIASVDQYGIITGRRNGTAVITVKTKDRGLTAKCTVKVITYATSISIDYSKVKISAGRSKVLKATISPGTATNSNVTWKSSNSKIAKVDQTGKVTGVAGGSATITATSGDGRVKDTCRVYVSQAISKLKITATTTNVSEKKGKIALKAVISPSTATERTIKWSSSNTKIATVDKDGIVTGKSKGKVTITAANSNGKVKATCIVNVLRKVTGVEIDRIVMTTTVGRKFALTAAVKPASASIKTVTWSSNNPSVATVDKNGAVTAKGPGYAEITVKTKDGGKKDVCKVTVIAPVKGVSLSATKFTADLGKTYTLKAKLKPTNASNNLVTWSSSNKSVVSVNSKGQIKGLKTGKATITVKTRDGGYTAKCDVTVVIKVKKISLNKTSTALYLDTTQRLKATITPSNATNQKFTWSSSDNSIVGVSSKGTLVPRKVGTATITAKTADGGLTAKCNVSVEVAATKIAISKSSLSLETGKSATITASVSPSKTTNKNITWTSSNKSVATVSGGKITALKAGKVTVTAASSNGLKKTCTVTVVQRANSIAINRTKHTLYTGESVKLTCAIYPADTTNKSVKWTTSNSQVASVAADGTVKALKAGTATITVTSVDGGLKASCVVTVKQHVTSLSFPNSEITVANGTSVDLSDILTIAPSDATDKTVVWTSSNELVASVSSAGILSAKRVGNAIIAATSNDGELVAKLSVNVTVPLTGFELSDEAVQLYAGETAKIGVIFTPSDAMNKNVAWSSSEPRVATVSSSGEITAISGGTAVIKAVTADGGFERSCTVTVIQKPERIVLENDSLTLSVGEEKDISVTVLPETTNDKTVEFLSSDPSVVRLDGNKLTAVAAGTAQVTVTCAADRSVKASFNVTVIRSASEIRITDKIDELFAGETFTAKASVYPADATDKQITWSSSNTAVASVSLGGVITASKAGTTTITATASSGISDSFVLTVKQRAETITAEDTSMFVGDSQKAKFSFFPSDTTETEVTFSSSDSETVEVKPDGTMNALKAGSATVTVTAKNGGAKVSFKVDVLIPAESVSAGIDAESVFAGKSAQAWATVLPENASLKNVTWESSDKSVATVSESGLIEAVNPGKATIKVTTEDKRATCSFEVTVIRDVASIELDSKELMLDEGKTAVLTANVLPDDAYNKEVVWQSSDESVATVDANGKVTAVSKGVAEITAISKVNGSVKAVCKVEVLRRATGVSLSEFEKVLKQGDSFTLIATLLPEGVNNTEVEWTSSDTAVATVDANGVVTAVGSGTATITATTKDGGFTASCYVTVE